MLRDSPGASHPARVFLIGLMGSGKSFWADKLGASLKIPAFHLDDEIEEAEQKTISEIFTAEGEDAFRLKESAALKSFAGKGSFILSTGGGTPCFHDNMNWMNAHGITIWIDESSDTIAGRLQEEKQHRPLIASVEDDKLHEFLSDMLRNRRQFYAQAKFHLREPNINETQFLKIILENE